MTTISDRRIIHVSVYSDPEFPVSFRTTAGKIRNGAGRSTLFNRALEKTLSDLSMHVGPSVKSLAQNTLGYYIQLDLE